MWQHFSAHSNLYTVRVQFHCDLMCVSCRVISFSFLHSFPVFTLFLSAPFTSFNSLSLFPRFIHASSLFGLIFLPTEPQRFVVLNVDQFEWMKPEETKDHSGGCLSTYMYGFTHIFDDRKAMDGNVKT